MLAVGAYCDYTHYHNKLCQLDECFDESLEHYETDTWFYIGQGSDKADDLTSQCYNSLEQTCYLFNLIEQRAKQNMIFYIKYVLSSTSDVQKKIFGCVFDIKLKVFDKKIDKLISSFSNLEYQYIITESFEAFKNHIKSEWKDYII